MSVAGQDDDADSTAGGGAGESGAFLGLGRSRYDGGHSEGNQPIVNEDL